MAQASSFGLLAISQPVTEAFSYFCLYSIFHCYGSDGKQ